MRNLQAWVRFVTERKKIKNEAKSLPEAQVPVSCSLISTTNRYHGGGRIDSYEEVVSWPVAKEPTYTLFS